ncbi:uncharacterized protein LOC142139843 [Mixophyes fleayi]|uniref:uncharacterized protein LOC142139843 n=1 Tax=Mixophyes fleayi TaxID=3061075 RepID=UPI003F4DA96B
MAQEKRATRRTGGGPPLRIEYTTYEEELRQIMPAEIVEGINVQDTDSPSFGQVVESPGPQFSPSARPTPPPSARDSGTDEQAGPSSYQPPQAESLEMSPEPEDLTTITLVTVDAPVSGLQEVSPGPAEPSHHQPAPETIDPAREMALSIGAFQQQQTLKGFVDLPDFLLVGAKYGDSETGLACRDMIRYEKEKGLLQPFSAAGPPPPYPI